MHSTPFQTEIDDYRSPVTDKDIFVDVTRRKTEMLFKYYDSMRPSVFDLDLFKVFDNAESASLSHRHDTIDEEGIKVELPGVKPEDINVSVEGRALKVTGKSRHGKEFVYSYTLKHSIDSEKIRAKFTNGLLEILLPRKDADESVKKIVIEV